MIDAEARPKSWYTVTDTTQAHYLGENNPADPTVELSCSRIDTPTTVMRKPTTGDTPCADCLTMLIAAAVDVDLPMGQCLGCGTLQPLAEDVADVITVHEDPSQFGASCLGQHRRPAQHDGRDGVRRRALARHKQLTDSLAIARDKFTHAVSSGRPITDAVGLLGEPVAQDEVTLTLVEELLFTGDYPATIERALGWMLLPQPVVAGADAMRETARREGARQWLLQARSDRDQWMPDEPADTPQETLLHLMAWL